jgi:peptidoglycan-associated lipoprotein
MTRGTILPLLAIVAVLGTAAACGGKKAPATPSGPQPFPAGGSGAGGSTAVKPPPPPVEIPPMPPEATPTASSLDAKSIEEINDNSPLNPVFFLYDSDELDDAARKTLEADAQVLKTNASWAITVEGHCDERGTAEYNLALGDRRALAAKNYLMSLGIAGSRINTVSYGKEFPFDPGHDEAAWAKNRRAHFMLTSK